MPPTLNHPQPPQLHALCAGLGHFSWPCRAVSLLGLKAGCAFLLLSESSSIQAALGRLACFPLLLVNGKWGRGKWGSRSRVSGPKRALLSSPGRKRGFHGLCWGCCPHPLKPPALLPACPAPPRCYQPPFPLALPLLLELLLGNRQPRSHLPRSPHPAPAAAPNMDVISVLSTFRLQIRNGVGKQCSACPEPTRNLLWTACSAHHVPPPAEGESLGDPPRDTSQCCSFTCSRSVRGSSGPQWLKTAEGKEKSRGGGEGGGGNCYKVVLTTTLQFYCHGPPTRHFGCLPAVFEI